MKTVEEIYQQMLKDFEARIGMETSNSCDLSVRLYATAAQIQALSAQTEWMEKQCFPQSAEGQYLDYHAQMRALTRHEAVCAVGTMRFSVNEAAGEDLTVPKGTVCISAAGVHYETTRDGVLRTGQLTVDVPAQAVEAGVQGNTGADTVITMSVAPIGIVKCTNPTAFVGGEDAESDESLRTRILDSYKRLPNGANAAFYESQAMRYPGVAAAKAIGRARGVGTVDVYVAVTSGIPEHDLLQEIQKDLAEKREISVDVRVLAPTAKPIPVTISLEIAEGAEYKTVKTEVEAALRSYFTGARLGKSVLLSQLHAVLHGVKDLANYHIAAPTADAVMKAMELPTLGTLTISAAG